MLHRRLDTAASCIEKSGLASTAFEALPLNY
jgi:hypothetical protein